jgi:DNA segregation ATPase FtsK/SpoIIIE, S-DNA-T family
MTGASGRTITVRRQRQGGRRRASQPSRASDVVSLARLELAPHHVDILGLALLASGVFLAGVGYLGWPGGALGHGAVNAAYFALGVVGFVVPAALALGGVMVLLRELHPPNRPIRGGVACLVAALTLPMAAGTLGLGLGPGEASARLYWQPSAFRSRGGLIGEAELWCPPT